MTEKLAGRYIIGDPSLVSYSGHCLNYIMSLANPLRARGHIVEIAGNRGMSGEFSGQLKAHGVFTYWCDARPSFAGISPNSAFGRQYVRWRHEKEVVRDLKDLDQRIRFTRHDTLILNTFRHWALRGIVGWFDALPDDRRPRLVIILHFSAFSVLGSKTNDRQMYADAFKRIEQSPNLSRILVTADSEELVREFRGISRLDVKVAPIPHTASADDEPAAAASSAYNKPLTAIYAGEARYNKGFHLLPYVVESLERNRPSRPWQFEIQSFINNPNEEFYKLAMGRLRQSSHCIFLGEPLDEAQYDTFVRRADIVLIPYLVDNYHTQTSGIYAEAVALGKPTIVPMGTWMGAQVRAYGGGLAFPPGDQQSLYEAVAKVIDNFDIYKANAVAASKAWAKFHSPRSLLAIIDEQRAA